MFAIQPKHVDDFALQKYSDDITVARFRDPGRESRPK